MVHKKSFSSHGVSSASLTAAPESYTFARSLQAHSRLVHLLRILFPLGGMALLMLIVLWSYGLKSFVAPRIESAIRKVNLVVNPRIHSIDNHGKPFIIQAQEAEQVGSLQAKLSHPSGTFQLDDGTKMEVSANLGNLQKQEEALGLSGNVDLKTGTGYSLKAPNAHVDLKEKTAETHEPVTGSSPKGAIKAEEGVKITSDGTIRFKGKTKLVIAQDPQRSQDSEKALSDSLQPGQSLDKHF